MCDPIVGVVLAVVGSLATAYVGAGIAKQQAKIEQEQLKVEMANERIKGMAETNDRLAMFRAEEAQNRAALSVTGVDTNLSYLQGIVPYNQRIVSRDIARIQFNTGQEIGRKKYEIAVAGWRARSTAVSGYVQAGANAAGTIGSSLISGSLGTGTTNPVYGQ